jgi:predicted dehydrogenase
MSAEWLRAVGGFNDIRIAGLVDIRPEAAEARAKEFGLNTDRVYTRLDQAIHDCRADAVFDVSVPSAHYVVTMTALKHRCHVLGEKPLADTLARARRMVEASRRARRIYAVIQNRRYEPGVRSVRAAIEAGHLGRVEEIHADFFLGPHMGGFRELMPHPLLMDMAIHTFDAARYLSATDPVAVYCHAFNPKRSWYRGAASAACVFEMTRGVTFTYRGSWCAEGLRTKWNSQWRLIGDRGTLTWDGDADIRVEVRRGRPPRGELYAPLRSIRVPRVKVEHEGHAGLIREFVDCVRAGRKPETIASDNIRSLAMVLAAVASAKSRRRVPVRW